MQFKLKSPHYIDGDKWLDTDTIVGDNTPYPISGVTIEMEPLDDDARKAISAEEKRLQTNQATMNPVDALPINMDTYEDRYIPGFNVRREQKK